jgi:hypothetical protein
MKEKINLDYDSISPITNEKCVIEEANENDNTISYLCMQSGFSSHENLIEGSEYQKKFETALTTLMKSCKHVAEDKKAWYPSFMRTPFAMLYIDGTDTEKFVWKVAEIVPIHGDERKKYPIVGKPNEYHTSRLDVENAKIYNKNDFATALDHVYSIVKQEYKQ